MEAKRGFSAPGVLQHLHEVTEYIQNVFAGITLPPTVVMTVTTMMVAMTPVMFAAMAMLMVVMMFMPVITILTPVFPGIAASSPAFPPASAQGFLPAEAHLRADGKAGVQMLAGPALMNQFPVPGIAASVLESSQRPVMERAETVFDLFYGCCIGHVNECNPGLRDISKIRKTPWGLPRNHSGITVAWESPASLNG